MSGWAWYLLILGLLTIIGTWAGWSAAKHRNPEADADWDAFIEAWK